MAIASTIGGLPHRVVVVEMPGSTVADAPTVVSAQLLDEDGVAYGVPNTDGLPHVRAKDWLLGIAEGCCTNHQPFRRFGVNADVPITWETVTNQSAVQNWFTAAERLHIVSDLAADDGAPAGNGAQTLNIKGLDGDYNLISETITMNGAGVVVTDASFLRVFRARVMAVGSSGANEGTIIVQNVAETITMLQVNPLEGQSNSAIWTVPAGKTAYIVSWNGSESSLKGALVGLWVRTYEQSWRYARSYALLDSPFFHRFMIPLAFSEKTDIEIRAKALSAGAIVSAGFAGWYEDA